MIKAVESMSVREATSHSKGFLIPALKELNQRCHALHKYMLDLWLGFCGNKEEVHS